MSTALAPVESGPDPSPTFQVQELLVPVRAHVATDDGKLSLTLDGELSYFGSDNPNWDRVASIFAGLTPLAELDAAGAHIDMPHSGSEVELFSLSIEQGTDGEPAVGYVSLHGYALYPGAPHFPNVVEDTSNRISCFGAPDSGEEAVIAEPEP